GVIAVSEDGKNTVTITYDADGTTGYKTKADADAEQNQETGVKATKSKDVASAQDALKEFNDDVADLEAARALNADLKEVEDVRKAAEDALTDSEEDGGLGVNLIKIGGVDQPVPGADQDVYLFIEEEGSVASFEGEDLIYFGTQYT